MFLKKLTKHGFFSKINILIKIMLNFGIYL
jgi:hypothetical protein